VLIGILHLIQKHHIHHSKIDNFCGDLVRPSHDRDTKNVIFNFVREFQYL
jgi:hypothetical protein